MNEIRNPEPPVLENLIDNMPGGFLIYRAANAELLYANGVALEIFGCNNFAEFAELTGGNFDGLVHPDDLDAARAEILSSGSKISHAEYRIRRRDGSIRWVDNSSRLVRAENGGDVHCIFLRDVTDAHVDRLENLRREKVIEGLSVGFSSIYLLNLDTGTMRPYRLKNSSFRAITEELGVIDDDKINWRDVVCRYAERCVLADDKNLYLNEAAAARIRERLKTEPSYTVTYRCVDTGGKIRYLEMFIAGVEEENRQQHVVMGYREVTEQFTQMRRDLAEKLNMEMELEREKHANEIKASFLFNISHDIRTPMNAIMGFTELARHHLREPNLLDAYLKKVDEANHHLIALIDDLLEMSRIDYGRVEIKSEPCDLAEQLKIVVDMFRPLAAEKNLALEENFDLPEGAVYVDSLRFRRIMGNLVSNAVKFTPSNGTVKISARRKRISDSGYARYEFSVADTGIGMTDELMQRMYNAFEREENSTRTGYLGTGLGLSITKKLLDVMGGSISVKSQKGAGSTFTVDLPLKLVDHAVEKIDAAPAPVKHSGEHRILLVEDIDVNRMLAEAILNEAGFLVESVPDGSDAVEIIKNHPLWYYDLVLMDIQMPVMNGYEATRSIRALGREDTAALPIIALSANAREEDKRMSMESGMNTHVAKPFDIAHLIATIEEYIATSSARN